MGILNSHIIDWYFRKTSTNNHVNIYELEQLPIPIASAEQQKPIIALIDEIMRKKAANPNSNSSELERQIDKLVYDLYGFTKEEIAVIEGA